MASNYLVDEWNARTRGISELVRYRQPGIGRSYPLLAYQNNRLYVLYFFHVAEQTGPNQMLLSAPFAYVVIDADDFSLVQEVADAAFDLEPFEKAVYEVSEVDKEANGLRITYLKQQYNKIARLYPDQPAGKAGQDFVMLLKNIVPPLLWPYYEALSPQFINWLGAGSAAASAG